MRVEYDISDEELQQAKELIAATKPASIKEGKGSASIVRGLKSVLSSAALMGGGAAYAAYVFKIDSYLMLGAISSVVLMVVAYVFYKALRDYRDARRDVVLSPGKKSCIEVLISEIHFIDHGIRSRLGRFDIKKFLNIQGYFLFYLDHDEVIVVPPGAFVDGISRDRFKEAVKEIIGPASFS